RAPAQRRTAAEAGPRNELGVDLAFQYVSVGSNGGSGIQLAAPVDARVGFLSRGPNMFEVRASVDWDSNFGTVAFSPGVNVLHLIGYVLLLAAVGLVPADVVAQRRPAARPAASRAQRPQFAAELNWSSDVDLGIGGRGVFPLQSLFPKTPLDGIVSFDYFFPSVPSGVSAHYWEINGNVAYRFTVPARSSFRPYGGGGLNIAHASAGPSGGTSVSET